MTKKFSELREFTDAQMARLKKEYEPLKGKTIGMANINKMNAMLNTYSIDMLMKLAKGDVPFLSTSAKSKLVIKHGKKWTDFKEPLDMAEADELQQEACWVGYKQVGMKKKGDRQVPNCVKEELVESKMQVQNLKTLSHRTAFRATIKKVLPSVVAYGSDSNPDFLTFVGSKSDLESLATMAKQYKVGPIRESMDDDCPTCNGGECQCADETIIKVCEDCGNDECVCVSLEEALKVKYDKTKQGWFDDKGRRRYLGNAATNAIMKKKLDHAIKTGDWTSFDVTVKEMMEAHQGQGLPPHLAKLFDKDGSFKDPKTQKKYQDMIDRQGKKNFKITDVTPKGYGPKEDLDSKDKETIEPIIKQLKKSVKAHGKQAKQLQKDIKDEADLTKTQIKMVHKKADDLPKNDFIKRYGKDGDSVRFATATNMVKKKLGVAENLIKGENEMNESYKDNFNAAMEELGINSLDELESVEEQKAFFSYVDSLEEGLTSGQKKLPPALQKAILKKQGETKDDKKETVSPAQQAAIAISKKEKGEEPKKEMKMKKEETEDVAEMAEMSPMNAMKMNAMTDPKKMNAMTMQDPKQDMIKKHSNDDIKAMKTMEMDMAKNNDDTETPSMEMMKAMMMKKDEMMKKETARKRMNAMKDANPMYAMKDAAQKEMMNAMKKVQMNDKKKIQATYEKYLVTKEGSLEAAVLTSVSTKKTD